MCDLILRVGSKTIHCVYFPDLAPCDFWLLTFLERRSVTENSVRMKKLWQQFMPHLTLFVDEFTNTVKVKWAERM